MERAAIARVLAIVAALTGLADRASAQERPGSVYVFGGVVAPYQKDYTGGTAYSGAPGGRTASWLVGGGVFVTPRMSIEAETWSTGVMAATQARRISWLDSSRGPDRFVFVGVKGHLRVLSIVTLQPVAGIAVLLPGDVTGASYNQEAVLTATFTNDPDPTVGVEFGGDIRIGGRHLAVVPSLRFAVTGRVTGVGTACYPPGNSVISNTCQPYSSTTESFWYAEYPRWTQRPSLSLLVSFTGPAQPLPIDVSRR
jgi:hypothetical protein